MDILDKAIIFATKAHSGALRKGGNTPYIVHPLEAVAIVATMTDDREIMAAAALHDVIEDTKYTADDIENEFGERVRYFVASDSENKREELPASETWKIRKQETHDYLREKASREEKMIVMGDKLSNIRAIYRDYLKLGDELFNRFNVKEKSKHAWYYRGFIEPFSELKEFAVYDEYVELVEKVFGE